MNFTAIHKVYFIGIGGIGMSNLARYFNHFGKQVFGYDKTPTELTLALEKEGIKITYEDRIETLPALEKDNSLIIYTPAIPANHLQKNKLIQRGFSYTNVRILGMITENTYCLAVLERMEKPQHHLLGHILHEIN